MNPFLSRSSVRRFMTALTAVALLGLSSLAGAQLYKWTDDQGRVQYSDKAPDKGGKKVDLKVNSYSGAPVVSGLGKPVANDTKGSVKLYTTTWCGYCAKARAHLKSKGIPYEDLDVEKSAQGKQEFAALKGRSVPVILIGSQRMDGFDPARLDTMLKAAGH
jgi:glutaredoxin